MCSQTAGVHRQETPATFLVHVPNKCGRWQVLRNNTGGFLPRASLFPHMPTATFRSTARLFWCCSRLARRVPRRQTEAQSQEHQPWPSHQCLLVTFARHAPKTHTMHRHWWDRIVSVSLIDFICDLVHLSLKSRPTHICARFLVAVDLPERAVMVR